MGVTIWEVRCDEALARLGHFGWVAKAISPA
jgi:hypothetical protein